MHNNSQLQGRRTRYLDGNLHDTLRGFGQLFGLRVVVIRLSRADTTYLCSYCTSSALIAVLTDVLYTDKYGKGDCSRCLPWNRMYRVAHKLPCYRKLPTPVGSCTNAGFENAHAARAKARVARHARRASAHRASRATRALARAA